MMDDETREYLDGEWFCIPDSTGRAKGFTICGPDGDSILRLDCYNAAHLLTPGDVADYLFEIHEEHRYKRV